MRFPVIACQILSSFPSSPIQFALSVIHVIVQEHKKSAQAGKIRYMESLEMKISKLHSNTCHSRQLNLRTKIG